MRATDPIKGELFRFSAKDGLNLHGLLVKSKENNKNVVINVFGMTGDFFSWDLYFEMTNKFKGSNFDLFLANNRGMGMFTPFVKKNKRFTIGTSKEIFEECIYDLNGAVDLLEKLGYTSIILMGHSTGCQKTTYYMYKTKDSRIKSLILLAPADDYNITMKELGDRHDEALKVAKVMVKNKKGDEKLPEGISKHYTAKRFLSYADLKNVEARLFNYYSDLKEFSRIKCPIFVSFGEKEEYAMKPVKEYIEKLKGKTSATKFGWEIVKGANHNFDGKHKELVSAIFKWLSNV